MKLVEILAKELAEWPDGVASMSQDDDQQVSHYDACAQRRRLCDWDLSGYIAFSRFTPSQLATDHATAIVTREMWQAERDKRSAFVVKLTASIDASQAKQVIDECIQAPGDDPRTTRDRIREIDATIEAITAERADLTEKLYAEGFMLVVAEIEPAEDMTDWRNWKVGDVLTVLDIQGEHHGFEVGENVTMLSHDTNLGKPAPYCESRTGLKRWAMAEKLKFHSRPTS